MRLSDVLAKEPSKEYIQVEGFLKNKKLNCDIQRKIDIGKVLLNYYCYNCSTIRTFSSKSQVYCLGIDNNTISIDMNLKCHCGSHIQIWFLIKSEDKVNIFDFAPKVKIIKKSEKLGLNSSININNYGTEGSLIECANKAYKEGLGAGAMVYLRMIYERVTKRIATEVNISLVKSNGRNKSFSSLLKEVDENHSIIPNEYKELRYKLFGELSEIIHGNSNEEDAINKYLSCKRLVIGIIDNIRNNREISEALLNLDLNNGEEVTRV